MITAASKATRRTVFADWLVTLDDTTTAEYGAERFKARDRVTRRQRIHPIFV